MTATPNHVKRLTPFTIDLFYLIGYCRKLMGVCNIIREICKFTCLLTEKYCLPISILSSDKISSLSIKIRLLSMLFITPFVSRGSLNDTIQKTNRVLPIIGFSPETSIYTGGVHLFNYNLNNSNSRFSTIKSKAYYTLKKQVMIENTWKIFTNNENIYTEGLLRYALYTDQLFIHDNNKITESFSYDSKQFFSRGIWLTKVNLNLFAGGGFRYGFITDIKHHFGKVHHLLENSSNLSLSGILRFDSRDNLQTTFKGYFLQFSSEINLSHSTYYKNTIDFRSYFKLAKRQYLLSRIYIENNMGTPAFYDAFYLGGDERVRGITQGKYRDQNGVIFQFEDRISLTSKINLGIFGGLSSSFTKIPEFIIPNYGMGLRYQVNALDMTYLRIDAASSPGEPIGFYIVFGDSF